MREICSSLLIILGLVVLLGGCTTPQLKEDLSGEFASEGLYKVKNSGFAEAFVRRDASLPGYRDVAIEPLNVSNIDIPNTVVEGTSRRDWQMTPERQATLQSVWAEAMNRAFSGYGRAGDTANSLRITSQLVRIAPGRPSTTTIGGMPPLGSSQDVVEIWAEFRLYDVANGELLGVIRDSRTLTSFALSRTAPATVRQLFGSWASLLHTRISGR